MLDVYWDRGQSWPHIIDMARSSHNKATRADMRFGNKRDVPTKMYNYQAGLLFTNWYDLH